jgi:vacuolar-type H+-ATPase subunit I/STV1
MAEVEASEFPSPKTAYLTIVDIFGALVPGLVWLTLILILVHFLLVGDVNLNYEYSVAQRIFSSSNNIFQSAVLVAYIAVGLTVGYIVKAFAMEVAGSIESIFHGLIIVVRYSLVKNINSL